MDAETVLNGHSKHVEEEQPLDGLDAEDNKPLLVKEDALHEELQLELEETDVETVLNGHSKHVEEEQPPDGLDAEDNKLLFVKEDAQMLLDQ
jgi:hypothetical protein